MAHSVGKLLVVDDNVSVLTIEIDG